MFNPTEEQLEHLREAILNLARVERNRKQLPADTLMLLFHLLAYGAPTKRFRNGIDAIGYLKTISPEHPEEWLGYTGGGWFVEDHF